MNILFVCFGDICRSPLAKGILRKKFEEKGIDGLVDSAGFEPYHIGHPVDKRTLRVAMEHGIDLSLHKMQLFNPDNFKKYDRILVMDQRDYHDVEYEATDPEDLKKVDFIMNVIDDEKKNKIIPDPLYKGYRSFEKIYDKLERACEIIAVESVK